MPRLSRHSGKPNYRGDLEACVELAPPNTLLSLSAAFQLGEALWKARGGDTSGDDGSCELAAQYLKYVAEGISRDLAVLAAVFCG